MELKELRVGNFITDEWASAQPMWQINRFLSRDIVEFGPKFKCNIIHIRPVPITHDRLLQLHCEHFVNHKYTLETSLGTMYINNVLHDTKLWYATIDGYATRNFQYIHDFQNLVFGLTGHAEI